jgi:pimeloyl-ACP methyl ester carboxylesterase
MTPEPDYDALDALVEAMPSVIDVTRDEVERLSIPSAGIVGSDDPELPNLEKLVVVLPGFELEILPGQPHETSWRDPSIPIRIRDFVKMASRNYDLRK